MRKKNKPFLIKKEECSEAKLRRIIQETIAEDKMSEDERRAIFRGGDATMFDAAMKEAAKDWLENGEW